jgi:hypothetical protein
MTGISIFADDIAPMLFEHDGRTAALAHVEEQIEISLRKADWEGVKSWRHVGSEIEKLALVPLKR